MERVGERVAAVPSYHATARFTPLTLSGELKHVTEPCLFYVRTSLCSSPQGREACHAIEANLELHEIARATIPAVPSYAAFGFDDDIVTVTISRARVAREAGP